MSQFWLWKSLRSTDAEARIDASCPIVERLDVRFDQGVRIERDLPLIEITRGEDDLGMLTDNQIAPAVRGLLLSSRLRSVLTSVGVDTLELFPARIFEAGVPNDDYCVANVIGRVQCFDLARSSVERHPGDASVMFIDSLALEERALGGVKMVRAAEHSQVIIVHESVVEACRAAGITGVQFFEPADYSL